MLRKDILDILESLPVKSVEETPDTIVGGKDIFSSSAHNLSAQDENSGDSASQTRKRVVMETQGTSQG